MEARILSYQLSFKKLSKELYEKDKMTYEKCIQLIRLKELLDKGGKLRRANKPTKKGTLLLFDVVKDSDELKEELDKVIGGGGR
nr:hypothetical protein [uncultured Lachnoclostridium sp.]